MIEPVGEPCIGGRQAIDCDISKGASSSDDDDFGDVGAGDVDRELSLRSWRDTDGESGVRGDKVLSEEGFVAETPKLLAVIVNPVMAMVLDLPTTITCARGASVLFPSPSVL